MPPSQPARSTRERDLSVEPDTGDPAEWWRSGVYEVAPGTYRVPLPLPGDALKAVNVYLVLDGDKAVAIDAGWAIPEAGALLGQALGALDLQPPAITRFLVTHVHRDHYTQAVRMRRDFGTPIHLGALEKESLESVMDPTTPPLTEKLALLRMNGAGRLADDIAAAFAARDTDDRQHEEWEAPDQWLIAGQRFRLESRTLEVHETPGHTRGHVVFLDSSQGMLFAGDHVLPTITPSIGFEPVMSRNPLGGFLRSLETVRRLPDTRLLPAHGPVTDSVHRRIDELVEHHGQRLDECIRAVETGHSTAYDVAGALRWTRRQTPLTDLDSFNQMLAVTETIAHLELLVAQRRVVRRTDGDGAVSYQSGSGQ